MLRGLLTFILGVLAFPGFAQLLPYLHHTERVKDKSDTTTLQSFFRAGEFYGHARFYFMATDNVAGLSDFYANAAGMGIGYETGKFKGFQIGISGFFIYNVFSSDFTKVDPKTGQPSRYEIGQFDMLNPNNRHDMDRLEDLYLKYSFHRSWIKFGKQHIKTPFINPQDGRMRPTLVEGALVEFNPIKKIKIEGGWLYNISPRSTVSWFGIGKSIGVFPAGINPDGSRSGYPNSVQSNGLYYVGITAQVFKPIKAQIWNFHIDNVLNSSLLQVNTEIDLNPSIKLINGLQYIHQLAVNHGGNPDQKLTYVPHNNQARTFGARLGIQTSNKWNVHVNYNRITKDGRYLMPREWGRDPFFTFMARERNEGFSDVHAVNTVIGKSFKDSGLKTELSYGHFYLPDVKDVARNKYGMPSYWQLNMDVRYLFNGFMKGLELQFLYVYKGKLGDTYGNDRFVINKVDMSLYNFVVNYHF